MRVRTAAKLILALLAASCADEDAFRPVSPPKTVEELEAIQAPGFPLPNPGTPVTVPNEDVDFLAHALPGDSRDALVKRVALRKLMASKFLEEHAEEGFELALTFRRALAQALLKLKFEKEHAPDTVPSAVWEEVFHNRHVLPMFDHFDSFFVVDVQIVCCKTEIEACAKSETFQACMVESKDRIREARQVLLERGIADTEHLKEAVRELSASGIPGLQLQEYSFQYNFAVPHEKQSGYKVVNENVARAARVAKLKELTEPVQSHHGWHSLFVTEFIPERHAKFGDPDVQAELKSKFYETIRHDEVIRFLTDLLKKHRFKVDTEALRQVNWESAL